MIVKNLKIGHQNGDNHSTKQKQFIRFSNYRRYKNFDGNWKNLGTKSQVYFYGKPLKRSESHKVLGIILQQDLKFEKQFLKMEKTLVNANNMLIRYFQREKWINLQAKISFAKALVRSTI